MADNRQYVALEWVVKEIKETLLQAQRALELYAHDADDVTQLQFCLTYIHQVYGSLHMAGFHGAAMIASEMEALNTALVENNVVASNEANEVLMRSIVQLPEYLEQVKYSKRDQPSLVISLLNDLRAVRGASFLTESALFSPNLDAAHSVVGTPHPITQNNQQFILLVSKLRKMYQYAAASIIRDVKVDESLAYLSKVSQRLCKTFVATKRFPLWEIVAAFVEGLENSSIAANASIKTLLRQLDNELLLLEKYGVKALDEFTNDELLKNLLYYLASAEEATRSITAIRDKYKLDHMIPFSTVDESQESESKPADSSAMRSVAKAILEEFEDIKTHLDACEYDTSPENHLGAVEQALQRVADTLAMLGVDDLRQKILHNVDLVCTLKEQSAAVSHDQLLDVARNIAEIEGQLDGELLSEQGGASKSSSAYHFDAAQETVLQESRNGLEQAKDAIVNYIATQWDVNSLKLIPDVLQEVRGGLSMLSLDYVASIVSAANTYIETQLITQRITPEWHQLDSLADIIASIDYYLEVMSLTNDGDESILESAERGLLELGVPVERMSDSPLTQVDNNVLATEADNILPLVANISSIDESSEKALVDESTAEEATVEETTAEAISVEEAPIVESTVLEDTTVAEPIEDDDDEDAIDPEILEIFIEEAAEVQEAIAEFFPLWANNFDDENSLIEFRRAFHTMKGSGRMVQANDVGELAWSVENMLNRVLDKTIEPSALHVALIERVVGLFPDMLAAFEHKQATPHMEQVEQYMAWANELSHNESSAALIAGLSSDVADAESPSVDQQDAIVSEPDVVDEEVFDIQLWEIFAAEAETHLLVVREYIATMDAARPFYEPPSDVMQRAIHTLKGSAHMAEMVPIAEMVTPMELFAKDLRSYQVNIDDDILQLIKDCVEYTEAALAQIGQHIYPSIPKLDQFLARVAELRERSVGHLIKLEEESNAPDVDPALLELLMTEGMNLLLNIDPLMRQWREHGAGPSDWQPIADELAILTHGAERANLASMAELSSVLGARYNELINGYYQANDDFYALLLEGHDGLLDIVDAIAAGQDLPARDELLVQRLEASSQQQVSVEVIDGVDQPQSEPMEEVVSEVVTEDEPLVVDNMVAEPVIDDVPAADEDSDVDDEIVEIFLDEAVELLDELDETTHSWENEGVDDRESNDNLQRLLHTFKGGARLAGLMDLGELAHDFETHLIQYAQGENSGNIFEDIHQYQDKLHKYIDAVRTSGDFSDLPDIGSLTSSEEASADSDTHSVGDSDTFEADTVEIDAADVVEPVLTSDEDITEEAELVPEPSPSDSTISHTEAPATILPFVPKTPDPASVAATSNNGAAAATARRAAPQEVVKVSADLMEELVNLAGETSISRGRMEEQISELGYSLDEMGATVERLQEQLRRLDIETEAQVLFRQEQIADLEDFDPLEMDRYSQLQQLSRSLIESASDLMDLKSTLADKTRDAETVLLQQSRINTELQEGLMRSRMVPFSRIVPRLRRIVRQISTELNKEVNFEFGNTEGELDRSMMERMVAPLEHMLRNAVDHGIEDVATREQSNKPAAGRIVLTLGREGSDVLIHLACLLYTSPSPRDRG